MLKQRMARFYLAADLTSEEHAAVLQLIEDEPLTVAWCMLKGMLQGIVAGIVAAAREESGRG